MTLRLRRDERRKKKKKSHGELKVLRIQT